MYAWQNLLWHKAIHYIGASHKKIRQYLRYWEIKSWSLNVRFKDNSNNAPRMYAILSSFKIQLIQKTTTNIMGGILEQIWKEKQVGKGLRLLS